MRNIATITISHEGDATGDEKLVYIDDVIQFFSMLGHVSNISKDKTGATASFDFDKTRKAAEFVEADD
ncbi:hypothetical protein JT737_19260 [Sinorhizobium meliloti]|uniref:hypothetical protein n=1 Tax=Rhizobium meliloti TaxID=382 RepID=UPI002094361D|nr:hypothetical protein [Sinorhizobium meliloti]MCO6423848.1 hypothetical protein [Sinorhizobium meliloti]